MQKISAEKYLEQYGTVIDLITKRKAEMSAIIEALYLVGIDYGKEKVQTSLSDRMAEVFAKADDMCKSIENDLKRLLTLQEEICGVIKKVCDSRLEKLLTLHYISLMPWDDVADEMGLTPRRIYQLRIEALGAVDKIIGG